MHDIRTLSILSGKNMKAVREGLTHYHRQAGSVVERSRGCWYPVLTTEFEVDSVPVHEEMNALNVDDSVLEKNVRPVLCIGLLALCCL